uniref:Uncharacterized protein n=1 Tax=uncultured prokaryote TaxID=198431 RepID=A0A0H5Q3V2_9ZZZZ|nr:hypothetical protein [uncultured prokaryote]
MSILTLDRTLCDWVTLTGLDHMEIIEKWREYVLTRDDYRKSTPQRWLQWKGESHQFGEGNIFTGLAEIAKQQWVVIRASGELAGDVLMYFYELIEGRALLKVTRLDLQITTNEPKGWGQINLCNRLYSDGKAAQFLGSIDGLTGKRLETVGVGSRTSEVYTRIYQKLTDGGSRLLRLEVEYKGRKAQAVVRDMVATTFDQQLKFHLQSKLSDDKLTAVFSRQLDGIRPHDAKPVARVSSKKRKWLLRTVLPSFAEYVNSHAEDGEVVGAYLAVLEDFC